MHAKAVGGGAGEVKVQCVVVGPCVPWHIMDNATAVSSCQGPWI